MRRISYAQTVIGTDEHLADLVLQYATVLARAGSADTVVVPGRVADGPVESVSLLVGPASQITSWSDAEPFDVDVSDAVADLERRIASATGGSHADEIGPGAIDEFDDLA
ncbi:hypothetical protein [Amnibacterium kyonggiense]|uniref:Uncharacterized protein n=1 Tax=Amnibacterium kyonggiense TaxID=595671 RepID=A0A4R7FR16_9MICO|nr:hypothetical protein [Amnibacterium kyonggiense]TDS80213.1 hypothetical protein CLV52_0767 [Amnibacterium kyonggiense]